MAPTIRRGFSVIAVDDKAVGSGFSVKYTLMVSGEIAITLTIIAPKLSGTFQ